MSSTDFTPADCAFFNICGPASTPTPKGGVCDHFKFYDCGVLITTFLALVLCPCYTAALWFTLRGILLCVRGTLHAICNALFGRALNVQLDSMEDNRGHEGSGMLVPLVFCGTWLRPPSLTEEAASVGQSEWSSVQPASVSLSSQVACKSALGVGVSESAVPADTPLPTDSKSSSSTQNSPEAARIAVMIQMPSPVFRCWKDREGPSYGIARLDNALPEYQIGVAQVQCVGT